MKNTITRLKIFSGLLLLSLGTVPPARADQAAAAVPSIRFVSEAVGNVFAAEEGLVELVLSPDARGGGTVTVADELGKRIATITVPAGPEKVQVQLPRKGFYRLIAELATADGTRASTLETAAVVGPLLPSTTRLESPFGLMARGNPDDTRLAIAAGAGHTRYFCPQVGIQRKADGQLSWYPGYESLKPVAINVVSPLMNPPPWVVASENLAGHSSKETPQCYPPADWDAYRSVVRFFAKSQSWVHAFEGINEPDANQRWGGSDADFVTYHRVIREELHAAGLGQKLYGPCFYQIDLDYLKRLVDRGLLDAVDAISIHTYAEHAPPEGRWIEEIRGLKAFLAATGRPMPIHLTEYGWTCGRVGTTTPALELEQARHASRAIALLAREHLASSIYFMLRWDTEPGSGDWSVVHGDYTPRPAYAAIATAYRWLTDCQGGTLLHPTPSSYLILFSRDGKSVGVVWDTEGSSVFQVPASVTRAEGMTGTPLQLGEDRRITVTQSPVYFECADPGLAAPTHGTSVRLVKGGPKMSLPVVCSEVALPGPLTLMPDGIAAPANAQAGGYVSLVKTAAGWQTSTVQVEPCWSVASAEVEWPDAAPVPVVHLTLRTVQPTATVTPLLRLEGRPDVFAESVALAAGQHTHVRIPIQNYANGTAISGEAVIEGRVDGKLDSHTLSFRALPPSTETKGSQ